jgi:hypothetical protein
MVAIELTLEQALVRVKDMADTGAEEKDTMFQNALSEFYTLVDFASEEERDAAIAYLKNTKIGKIPTHHLMEHLEVR